MDHKNGDLYLTLALLHTEKKWRQHR